MISFVASKGSHGYVVREVTRRVHVQLETRVIGSDAQIVPDVVFALPCRYRPSSGPRRGDVFRTGRLWRAYASNGTFSTRPQDLVRWAVWRGLSVGAFGWNSC